MGGILPTLSMVFTSNDNRDTSDYSNNTEDTDDVLYFLFVNSGGSNSNLNSFDFSR